MKMGLMENLPYRCKEVLELYGSGQKEIDQLETLQKSYEKLGMMAEMYYSHRGELSYATLVIFLSWTLHGEISKFDPKAFKKWHSLKTGVRRS
ncbi:MAG: hypothetical protein HYS07_07305 [Chlamydiae bacterium]|nr:hypothetical protein [Chlamydiota bacterium]MBI3276641.1 hypothetical protein [Chlamydiota bacterium]